MQELIEAVDGCDHISQAYGYARVVDDLEAEEYRAEDHPVPHRIGLVVTMLSGMEKCIRYTKTLLPRQRLTMKELDELHHQHSETLCILLTAYGSPWATAEARQRGAALVVDKPVRLAELRLDLHRLVGTGVS